MSTRGSSTLAVHVFRRSAVIFGVVAVIGGTAGPRFRVAKYFSTRLFVSRRVEVADDRQRPRCSVRNTA
jgi:hypothetical protein